MSDIGRRAVACKAWRWVPGMRWHENATPGAGLYRGGVGRVPDDSEAPPHAATPDLTDPATLGCLLRLVREAWRDRSAWCEADGSDLTRWVVFGPSWATPRRIGAGATEGTALVAALEAAPVLS